MTVKSSAAATRSVRRPRRGWVAALAMTVGTLLGGCAGIAADPTGLVAAGSGAAGDQGRERAWSADELRADFDDFASKLPGKLAIAWAAVGSRQSTQVLGSVTDQDAWSTAKVPLGVARLRLAGGKFNEKTTEVLRLAIQNSDNAAARILWRGLGTPTEAVALMDKMVRDAGDETTTFSEEGFGRSTWTVGDQAQFAAGLPCIQDGPPVLDLMGEIAPEHQWGLARSTKPSKYKGGWGIGKHGLLVRQFGVVETGDGKRVGIALATMPATKDMTVAATNLDTAAQWLTERLGPADGGACG